MTPAIRQMVAALDPQSLIAIPVRVKNLTGKKFSRLLVIKFDGIRAKGKERFSRWKCLCDCGRETIALGIHLSSGNTKSCGCLQREYTQSMGMSKRKHGLSRSKEESAWRHMLQRCYSEKSAQYKNYGARGIVVCDRWKNFQNFIEDIGLSPSRLHSLDRINVNGNYSKENCRWATQKEQQQNRSNNHIVEYLGERKSIAEWCDLLGMRPSLVYARIKKLKWNVEAALTKPARKLTKVKT